MGGGERSGDEPTGKAGVSGSPHETICILQCNHCKRVFDSVRGWLEPAGDLSTRADLTLSHGICPDCLKRHFPEFS